MHKVIRGAAVLACLLAFHSGAAQAQFPLRVLAGPTISTISTDDFDTSSKMGFFVAAGTSFSLNERFSISPFLGYVQKGTEFSDGSNGSYDYIEIPVLLGTQVPVGEKASLSFSLGPQVAFNINCDEDGFDCTEYADFKSTEFGIVGGAGIGFPLSEPYNVSFGVSFDFGLTDLYDIDSGYKNRVIYLWASLGTVIGG
jgi:hypothetical protein